MRSAHLERLSHDWVEGLVGPQPRRKAALRKRRHQQQPVHAPLGQLGSLHCPRNRIQSTISQLLV